jgi:hypothetical protein
VNGQKKHRVELAVVAAFVVVQLLAPLIVGEVYPFTISPMFSDQPSSYAIYSVFDESGKELDASQFGLHLVYDGNPPGFGVGVCPLPTAHGFGEVSDCDSVARHVQKLMQSDSRLPRFVRVRQQVVQGGGEQLATSVNEWLIRADGG